MTYSPVPNALPDTVKFIGATLKRSGRGWVNNKSQDSADQVYSSLFEAIASMFGGRFTALDMAHRFKFETLSLPQVYSENPAATLHYIRQAWMHNFILYHPATLTRAGRKPTDVLEQQIEALRTLMVQIGSSGALELYAALNEASEHYKILLDMHEANWTKQEPAEKK